ncbi:hypothetical protein HANVADRAFT_51298 [Hanseniaspora valbyensis NRRL Y-1626]|uniref:Uncharacterized protein n=1 Tax=Hanseniaspora valbyensis NRRL Y-1626 TaxID=766949 RepID=A0A1B7TJE2_9ASCO|nr:hypothetical protein HANVADRAFT_51298 [Hanseniaspora valbyensis NRRL Y-1626]
MSLKFLDFSFKIQRKNTKSIINTSFSPLITNKLQTNNDLKSLTYNTFGNAHTLQPELYNPNVLKERKFFNSFVKDKRRADQLLRGFNIDLYSHIIKDLRSVKQHSKLFHEKDNANIHLKNINPNSILATSYSRSNTRFNTKLNLSLQGLNILKSHLLQLIYTQNVFDNLLSLKELELKYRFNMNQDIIAIIETKLKDFQFHITMFDLKKEQISIAYTNEKNLQTILSLFGYLSYYVNKKTLSEIIMKTFEKDFILMNDKFLSAY